MSIYTVHQPPLKANETSVNPDRIAFVRDGFHFWAFLFGPVWMLWRRLWLAALLYILLLAVLAIAMGFARIGGGSQFTVLVLIALLVGFEAATLRRWTLRRRGWTEIAAVVGDDPESAERRFFATWTGKPVPAQPSSPAPASPPPPSAMRVPRDTPDVIGLFPEPGGPR
jgi:hypothetical protein